MTAINLPGPIQRTLQQLRYAEPAALKARWTMALQAAAVLGLTVPGWVDRYVGIGLAALAIVGPWLQGKRTRADVWSQQTVDDLAALVALFPDFADEARRLLGAGLQYRIVREHIEAQAARPHRSAPEEATHA